MRIESAILMVYPAISGNTIGQTSSTLFYRLKQDTYREYADLTMRGIESTWPTEIYDDGAFPCRNLSFWPVPQTQVAVELWLWQPLTTYANLDEELNLPTGYERYLVLKLALEIAPEFGKSVTQTLVDQYEESRKVVQNLNQQVTKSTLSNAAKALGGRPDSWLSSTEAPYTSPKQF